MRRLLPCLLIAAAVLCLPRLSAGLRVLMPAFEVPVARLPVPWADAVGEEFLGFRLDVAALLALLTLASLYQGLRLLSERPAVTPAPRTESRRPGAGGTVAGRDDPPAGCCCCGGDEAARRP